MTNIDELRKTLEGSVILESKQQRLKVLLDDIAKNRYRVKTIIRRMADAVGETEEQYLRLAQLEELDSSKLIDVIKESKIGKRLRFLPRKLSDLINNLQIWLGELTETGRSMVLEELLRWKGISHERYTSITEDNDVLNKNETILFYNMV